jgi:hypothetical protein
LIGLSYFYWHKEGKKQLELENCEFGYIGDSFQRNTRTCMIK